MQNLRNSGIANCSIAVCSKKKKTGRCYAETKKKKKKKGLDFLNLKSVTFALQTVRFDLLPLSRVVKP